MGLWKLIAETARHQEIVSALPFRPEGNCIGFVTSQGSPKRGFDMVWPCVPASAGNDSQASLTIPGVSIDDAAPNMVSQCQPAFRFALE